MLFACVLMQGAAAADPSFITPVKAARLSDDEIALRVQEMQELQAEQKRREDTWNVSQPHACMPCVVLFAAGF
jgi:hypothetical protein